MSGRARPGIRPARTVERADLEALRRRAGRAEGGPCDAAVSMLAIERGEILVSEEEGAIVGFARVAARDGYTELTALLVDPDLRGCGLGAALVEAAVHRARRQGLALVALARDPEARRFLQRCGLQEEGSAGTADEPTVRLSR